MSPAEAVPSTATPHIELPAKGRRYCAEQVTRAAIEAEVERLIDLLDHLDAADEDLEDGFDLEQDAGDDGIADLAALQAYEAEAFALRFCALAVAL